MGLFSSIALAVAPKIVGGLFGKKSKSATTTSRVDYQHIRDGAEAAGFNPLTALRNGGSANATSVSTQPGLSSGEWLADAIGAGANAAANYDPLADKRRELEVDLMEAELDRMQKSNRLPRGIAGGVPTLPEFANRPIPLSGNNRPLSRPSLSTDTKIPVFLPDGQQRNIPSRVAEAMNLDPWGYVAAGQYAELVGELRGEGETAIQSSEIGDAINVPLFGDGSEVASPPPFAKTPQNYPVFKGMPKSQMYTPRGHDDILDYLNKNN